MKKVFLVLTAVMFCVNAAFAGQTIDVVDNISYGTNVFGNGDASNNGYWGADPALLLDSNGNTVNATADAFGGSIVGGYADSRAGLSSANNNAVHISSSISINGNVYGGSSYSYDRTTSVIANGNVIDIIGGSVSLNIVGGIADTSDGKASSDNNFVTIVGTKLSNDIYGDLPPKN